VKLAAWIALALAGVLSWAVGDGRVAASRAPELATLPDELGRLTLGADVSFDAELLGESPPDRWTFREVAAPGADAPLEGVLYVAYFLRGKRWSGRPHPVEVCYDALGWEELEARSVEGPAGSLFWSRRFEREGRRIRVFHWLQRPGQRPRSGFWSELAGRFRGVAGLRQDVASIYWEFPDEGAPEEALLAEASEALTAALERAWH